MIRFIHDQLAKGILEETLSLGGKVEIEVWLTSEVQRIDIRFTPMTPSPPVSLGLQRRVLELVYDAWAVLDARQQQAEAELDSEERVLYMQLSGLYHKHVEEIRKETHAEALQQGLQEGR